MHRLPRFPLAVVAAALVAAIAGSSAAASPPAPDRAITTLAKKKRKAPRRGGHVRAAWPANPDRPAPKRALVRWLARQAGPERRTRSLAAASDKLLLIRSFDIPSSDAAHDRLANYSFTYDNALATFAFISVGAKTQAEQLLDQLKALQRTDGSIEYAFDVSTGASAPQVRAGALAWVGYAASAYRNTYDSTRYDTLIAGIARYLLNLRNSSNLIKGGPDVSWVSTQHNLLAIGFLRDIAADLGSKGTLGSGLSSSDLTTAQTAIANAVLSQLLAQDGSLYYFRQGVGDGKVPADVQALGAMYLDLRNDSRASKVAEYLRQRFYVSPRAGTAGTLAGYKPFYGTGSPDVIWSEGTLEASLAFDRTGVDETASDDAVRRLLLTIKGVEGPAGADRDVDNADWGEYHTWATSAAGSWLLIRAAPRQLLFAR